MKCTLLLALVVALGIVGVLAKPQKTLIDYVDSGKVPGDISAALAKGDGEADPIVVDGDMVETKDRGQGDGGGVDDVSGGVEEEDDTFEVDMFDPDHHAIEDNDQGKQIRYGQDSLHEDENEEDEQYHDEVGCFNA